MSADTIQVAQGATAAKGWRIALWVCQAILAAMFLMTGTMKLMHAAEAEPLAFWLFVGTAEVLGAIGVVIPALTRIKPLLTPLAAGGLATIMVLAIGYHISRDESFHVNVILGAIALFVVWGRATKAPIEPR